jgi:phytanoyl-CoA hydroxylase
MILDREIELYRNEGWVVVDGLLQPDILCAVRQVVNEFVEGARGVTAHNEIYDLEPCHQPHAPMVRRIKAPHKHAQLFWDIARLPRVRAILERFLKGGFRLQNTKINLKLPGIGSPVEWHQDWAFYPHTNDDLLAMGVMLDNCTVENGAMMVMPGTHLGPLYDHHSDGYFCGAINPTNCDLDFAGAVPVVGNAGTVSFHHARLVHGSAQNLSTKPRNFLLYEFTAADAWPLLGVADLAEFDSRLVSGKPTIEPRLAPVPVRLPLPPSPRAGSIYENQSMAKHRYFQNRSEATGR